MTRCDHPKDQRWYYRFTWLCCACHRWFWIERGYPKPNEDIYGEEA